MSYLVIFVLSIYFLFAPETGVQRKRHRKHKR